MTAWQIALVVVCPVTAAAIIAALIWLNNNLIAVTRYNVPFKTEREVKIVQISDLHGKSFGEHNNRLISKVFALRPDAVVITGDLIHEYSMKNILVALRTVAVLSAVAPVIYVSGNHEMRNKGYRRFKAALTEEGATVLDNSETEVCGITFAGLNGASNKNDAVFNFSKDPSSAVLLAHMPHHIERYARAGYALVLCGHAHGGQWRIPFTGRGIYAPGQGLFPKYTSGIHRVKDTEMIISRGLGNSEFPVRLFNRPEIVMITLVPKSCARADEGREFNKAKKSD